MLKVTEIQRFCMHDGPGVRTTVFLKGCPLRCAWCHNPETQNKNSEMLLYNSKCIGCGSCIDSCKNNLHRIEKQHIIDRERCSLCGKCVEACPACALEICGKDMSIEEILSVVEKDRAFYGAFGGITLSGGEPFMQREKTVALLAACKARGLSTAVETCGYADTDILLSALPYVDLFLWDIKDTDNQRHKQYTGVYNDVILKASLFSLQLRQRRRSQLRADRLFQAQRCPRWSFRPENTQHPSVCRDARQFPVPS